MIGHGISTVDILASFLEDKGISNYLVELGGEVKTKGKKALKNIGKLELINQMKHFMKGGRYEP